jgi:hypothetical protein
MPKGPKAKSRPSLPSCRVTRLSLWFSVHSEWVKLMHKERHQQTDSAIICFDVHSRLKLGNVALREQFRA